MTPGARQILISTLFFSIMQICVKNLEHIPTSEVVFFRALVSLVICASWLKYKDIPLMGTNHGWLVARGIAGTCALFLFFFSVQRIPLASAVTLQYLSPVFTVIIASFAFREHGSVGQWFFMLLSFGGVFLIQGFDDRVSTFMAVLCVTSAFCSAIAYNIIRKIGRSEHPLVIVFYFPLVTATVLGPVALYEWVPPKGIDWLFLFGTGVSVHFAQVFMTQAYQNDRAADIVTLKYVGAVFALLIGYLGFDETFGTTALMGMALVTVGAIGANHLAMLSKKRA